MDAVRNADAAPIGFSMQQRFSAAEIGTPVALLLAAAIGLAYALLLFGPEFLNGSSVFWQRPVGLAGGPFDLKTNLAGYFWVVEDKWRWPLLWLPHVNTPTGMDAYQFDSMPGLVLLGKLLRSLGLGTLNLYPDWIVAAVVLNAVAMTLLLRALGRRSLLACVVAAGFGVLAPVVHYRFGHSALMAQFFPIFALALYFEVKRPAAPLARCLVALLVLCFIVATINLYMYVMTAAIAAAALLHLAIDRRLGIAGFVASFVVLLLVAVIPVWAFGAFRDPSLREITVQFGHNSMNLMSPFWPQSSGLFRWTGAYYLTRGSIGATAGQWEGYSYVGAGALLLIVLGFCLRFRTLPGQIRKYWVLACALAILAIWAISDRIYFGPYLIARYPVPHILTTTVLAWFRASGRFFWPVGWMATAFGISAAIASLRPRAALVVCIVALLIQWQDVSYMRGRIEDLTRHPPPSEFGSQANADQLNKEIASRRRLVIIPSYYCHPDELAGADKDLGVADVEAELMASRASVDTWNARGSRAYMLCSAERAENMARLVGDGVLVAFPTEMAPNQLAQVHNDFSCWQANASLVCTAKAAPAH